MLGGVLFFLSGALLVIGAIASPVLRDTRMARNLAVSKVTYAGAEGALEDALYRYIKNKTIASTYAMSIGSSSLTISAQDVVTDKVITAVSADEGRVRKVTATIVQGDGASFNAGLQAGTGGISMTNSASVIGNVFSNGPVTGSNSNIIYGGVVSAGQAGIIDGAHATGTAYAHTIQNAVIDKDAYYQVITSSTVGGTNHPNSTDVSTTSLPISDAQVTTWENDAAAGGTISTCPYTISANTTLGPKKIACDLTLKNATLNLTGPLWITGNFTVGNGSSITIDPSVGNKSVAIVVDNPSDRATGSTVTLQNNISFSGNGNTGSFVLLLSQNNSAENGGSTLAINLANQATGDLMLYAGHGKVSLSNNTGAASPVRTVTAYRIELSNSAQVIYKIGLISVIFTEGPSAGYSISKWQETQ